MGRMPMPRLSKLPLRSRPWKNGCVLALGRFRISWCFGKTKASGDFREMAKRKSTASRTVRVSNPLGLHARPCSLVVQTATHFPDCQISVTNGRQKVNGKSIMGVLGLAAAAGTELLIETEGPNAEKALEAVCRVIAELETFEQFQTREETMDAWRKLIAEVTSTE